MQRGTAIIIGAGPAGLTAAIELQRRTQIQPILLEASQAMGGLARTICYKGNRMDIGGHRFFSKSDRVMDWWLQRMPLEAGAAAGELRHQGAARAVPLSTAVADPRCEDRVMLVRNRRSRIYFLRRFFHYPIRFDAATLRALGLLRALRCGLSYALAVVLPRRHERSLEDFLINRFGRELYRTFFQSYTEKVWGVPCSQISAAWGVQRIKGLSLSALMLHRLRKVFRSSQPGGLAQKKTETSLIEQFLYPKLGPGQLWEHVADQVRTGGGQIHLGIAVDRIQVEGGRVTAVEGVNTAGERQLFRGDYFFSTMPVRDLIRAFADAAPAEVREVSEGLVYRDFITVGLLAKQLAVTDKDGAPLRDNWIYVHEPEVTLGRVQIFNNWSPWLVRDPEKVWIGLEYFCNQSDAFWQLSDEAIAQRAVEELSRIGLLKAGDVEDAHVVRVPKAYPAYFGAYERFSFVRRYTDSFPNLFLIGRNGMHRYNNQDHSMLTAMTAVDNIVNGVDAKDNIWAIHTEMEYQEETASH